ncbi:MAG: SHOCT domain-containing protein [Planctomycetes bacterium]|nr:SHOCT domain-containing protein [Planctomycetota bacterium]
MLSLRPLRFFALLFLLLGLSSCAWSIGSDKEQVTRTPTIAEELRDLQEARDDGLMTESEYQVARQKVLDGSR